MSDEAFQVGDVIVMRGRGDHPPYSPGQVWFRISRGWINGFGSEVPAESDWPTRYEPFTRATVLLRGAVADHREPSAAVPGPGAGSRISE